MKRFGRTFCGIVFKLLLVIVPLLAAISVVFGTPKYLKQALTDNKVYSSAVDSLIEEVIKSQAEQGGSLPVSDPAVQQAIKNAFPSSTIQSAGENVIEGVYGWLGGETQTPVFEINLSDSIQKIAEGVSNVAAARLQSLPICTQAQLYALRNSDVDPFSVPCQPADFDMAAERQKWANEIVNAEFKGEPIFTAADLPKNDNGQTITDQASAAPTVFQLARATPLFFGLLLLLFGAGWILLFDNRRRGLRALSFTLIGAGVFLLVMFGVLGWLFNKVNETGDILAELSKTSFSRAMTGVAQDLTAQTNRIVLIFGIVYLVLGAGLWLALRFVFKAEPSAEKLAKEVVNDTSDKEVGDDSEKIIEGEAGEKQSSDKDSSDDKSS